jgi:hypothetical protein
MELQIEVEPLTDGNFNIMYTNRNIIIYDLKLWSNAELKHFIDQIGFNTQGCSLHCSGLGNIHIFEYAPSTRIFEHAIWSGDGCFMDLEFIMSDRDLNVLATELRKLSCGS